MGAPKCTQSEFIELFETHGPAKTAKILKCGIRTVYDRRRGIEARLQRTLNIPNREMAKSPIVSHPHRIQLDIKNGCVIVGSDLHIWPGTMSTAMLAFIKLCRDMSPAAVILNGDVMDFPRISRHPPIGWENQPTVIAEIEAAQDQLSLVEKATFKARKIWALGNHDGRFETRLATIAPEYAKINGVHLRDHFPNWEPCWSVFINDNVVVKHRFKSGIHAPHNNTMWAGRTIVTGHLHSQKVQPITDYNGTRYGVDTGCIASPDASAFVDYTEDNPKSWRSGFGVLTFVDGQLLPPELVTVWDSTRVVFRGQLIEVPNEAKKTQAAARPPRSNSSIRGRRKRANHRTRYR